MLVEPSRSKNASAVAVTASTEVLDSSFRFLFRGRGVSQYNLSEDVSRELALVCELELEVSCMSLLASSMSKSCARILGSKICAWATKYSMLRLDVSVH